MGPRTIKIEGGEKLKAYLDGMVERLSKAKTVDIGFFGGATYPDGTSVPMVAAINEFGRPDIGQPPRPFFRGMIADKQGEWGEATAEALRTHEYDAALVLGQIGQAIAGQLQQSIVDFTSPPLSPVTVAAKGFEKPLVDTGQMLKEVKFVVNSEKD